MHLHIAGAVFAWTLSHAALASVNRLPPHLPFPGDVAEAEDAGPQSARQADGPTRGFFSGCNFRGRLSRR